MANPVRIICTLVGVLACSVALNSLVHITIIYADPYFTINLTVAWMFIIASILSQIASTIDKERCRNICQSPNFPWPWWQQYLWYALTLAVAAWAVVFAKQHLCYGIFFTALHIQSFVFSLVVSPTVNYGINDALLAAVFGWSMVRFLAGGSVGEIVICASIAFIVKGLRLYLDRSSNLRTHSDGIAGGINGAAGGVEGEELNALNNEEEEVIVYRGRAVR